MLKSVKNKRRKYILFSLWTLSLLAYVNIYIFIYFEKNTIEIKKKNIEKSRKKIAKKSIVNKILSTKRPYDIKRQVIIIIDGDDYRYRTKECILWMVK